MQNQNQVIDPSPALKTTRDQILRLVKQWQSPEDDQALAAIRRANQLLEDLGVGWEDVVVLYPEKIPGSGQLSLALVTKQEEHAAWFAALGALDKLDLFDALLVKTTAKTYEFIESVHDWWRRTGTLSDKQVFTLWRVAVRLNMA